MPALPRLAIFAKAPVLGGVKTRLARAIGATAALEAHRQLLLGTLARLSPGGGRFAPELWLAGAGGEFDAWARWLPMHQQPAGDLGTRMAAAFAAGVTALVGCDIPALAASHVDSALAKLAEAELVLGPTTDGGYCLIAMREPNLGLFQNIPWGTSGVLAATKAAAGGRALALLDPLWDVDEVASWRRWRACGVQPATAAMCS